MPTESEKLQRVKGEREAVVQSGREALRQILGLDWRIPQTIGGIDKQIKDLDLKKRAAEAASQAQGTTLSAADQEKYQAAHSELEWERGETMVAQLFWDGDSNPFINAPPIGEAIEKTLASWRKETIAKVKGGTTIVYLVPKKESGQKKVEEVKDEEEAKARAVSEVMAQRLEFLRAGIELFDKVGSGYDQLSAEEKGAVHASMILAHYAQPVLVAEFLGGPLNVRVAREALKKSTGIEGLVTKKVDEAISKAEERGEVPVKGIIKAMTSGDIARAVNKQDSTLLGRRVGEVINRVCESFAGRTPTSQEIRNGVFDDLGKVAREEATQLVDQRVKKEVQDWFVGGKNRPDGIAGLEKELKSKSLLSLDEWAERNGVSSWLRALRALDTNYRNLTPELLGSKPKPHEIDMRGAAFPKSGGGDMLPSLPLDLQNTSILLEIVCGDLGEDTLTRTFETGAYFRHNEFKKVFAERARLIGGFGLPSDRKEADLDRLFRHYPETLTEANFAATKLAERGIVIPVYWVEGDSLAGRPITRGVDTFLGKNGLWIDAARSLDALAKIDRTFFNFAVEIAWKRDQARRAGIDLLKFAADIASGVSPDQAAIRACSLLPHSNSAKELLKSRLVTIASYLLPGTDGKLDRQRLMAECVEKRAGKGGWIYNKAPQEVSPDVLFKHLSPKWWDNRAQQELLTVLYSEAYEARADEIAENEKDKFNVPQIVRDEVDNNGLLLYEIMAETGINIKSSGIHLDIANVLKDQGGDLAGWGWILQISEEERKRRGFRIGVKIDAAGTTEITGLPDEARKVILMQMGIDVALPIPPMNYKTWRINLYELIGVMGDQLGLVGRLKDKAWARTGAFSSWFEGLAQRLGQKGVEEFFQKIKQRGPAEFYTQEMLDALLALHQRDPVDAFIAKLKEKAYKRWVDEIAKECGAMGEPLPDSEIVALTEKWRRSGLIEKDSSQERMLIKMAETGKSLEALQKAGLKGMTERGIRGFYSRIDMFPGMPRWWVMADVLGAVEKWHIGGLNFGKYIYKALAPRPRMLFGFAAEIALVRLTGLPISFSDLLGIPQYLTRLPLVGEALSEFIYLNTIPFVANYLGPVAGVAVGILATVIHWRSLTGVANFLIEKVAMRVTHNWDFITPRPGERGSIEYRPRRKQQGK